MATHLLALGVNECRSLDCSEQNAHQVVSLFKECYDFEANFLETRTVEAVAERLRKLEDQFEDKDVFVFYFSGHGLQHAQDYFLLLPHADPKALEVAAGGHSFAGALSCRHLEHLTSRPRWTHITRLLILDTGVASLVANSPVIQVKTASACLPRELVMRRGPFWEPFSRRLTVLSSCVRETTACEMPEHGHTLFTACLLDIARSSEHQRGALSVDTALCEALEAEMGSRARQLQLPSTASLGAMLAGESVLLRSHRSAGPLDEDGLWALCQAQPKVENLERFIRLCPKSDLLGEAVARLNRLGGGKPIVIVNSVHPALAPSRPRPAPLRVPSLYPQRLQPGGVAAERTGTSLQRSPSTVSDAAADDRKPDQPQGRTWDPVAEILKRDQRLWSLVRNDPSPANLRTYLSQASPGAPKRGQVQKQLDALESKRPIRESDHPPIRKSETRAERSSNSSRAEEQVAREWNPAPDPDFVLSLDRATGLFSSKKGK